MSVPRTRPRAHGHRPGPAPHWLVLILAIVALAGCAQTSVRDNFSLGELDAEWNLDRGWGVEDGMLVGRGHRHATLEEPKWASGVVHFRLMSLEGGLHVSTKVTDAGRFVVGFYKDDNEIEISRHAPNEPDARMVRLARTSFRRPVAAPYEIRFGNTFVEVWRAGERVLQARDIDPLPAGAISFESLDNSTARVDNLRVSGHPPGTWLGIYGAGWAAIAVTAAAGAVGAAVVARRRAARVRWERWAEERPRAAHCTPGSTYCSVQRSKHDEQLGHLVDVTLVAAHRDQVVSAQVGDRSVDALNKAIDRLRSNDRPEAVQQVDRSADSCAHDLTEAAGTVTDFFDLALHASVQDGALAWHYALQRCSDAGRWETVQRWERRSPAYREVVVRAADVAESTDVSRPLDERIAPMLLRLVEAAAGDAVPAASGPR